MQNNIDGFKNKLDPNSKVRHLFDIARGLMYICVGVLMFSNKNIGVKFGESISKSLGIIILFYGVFRIWRFYYNNKNKIEY
jgi:hypothetical protein